MVMLGLAIRSLPILQQRERTNRLLPLLSGACRPRVSPAKARHPDQRRSPQKHLLKAMRSWPKSPVRSRRGTYSPISGWTSALRWLMPN